MKLPTTETTAPFVAAEPAAVTLAPARQLEPPRIAVLDGIRGLAILLVMFCHFTVFDKVTTDLRFPQAPLCAVDEAISRFASEFSIGVDLFFVLSGYLITGILFDARGDDHYFRNFYARRTLRIFPLWYAVVAIAVVLPLFNSPAINRFGPLEHSWCYWTYLSNVPIAINGFNGSSFLGVSWSLAIEEQFYLVWPTVVCFASRRLLMRICAVVVVLAPLFRLAFILTLDGYKSVNGALTPCRMEGLAIGAWLALESRRAGGLKHLVRLSRTVLLAGIPVVVALMVLPPSAEGRLGIGQVLSDTFLFTIVDIVCGAALVMGVAGQGTTTRLFALRPLQFLGRYSYALYLFHIPIRQVVRDSVYLPPKFPTIWGSRLPGQMLFYVLALTISVAAALFSWHVYEKQAMKLKKFFPMGRGRGRTAKA